MRDLLKRTPGPSIEPGLEGDGFSAVDASEEGGAGNPTHIGRESAEVPLVNLPAQVFIGYYAYIKKRDLVKYLFGYSQTHCSAPNTARYQIKKYLSGYMYELHDGGSAGGVLSGVIRELEAGRAAVIRTSGRRLKIVSGDSGPSSYLLNESDSTADSPGIRYSDKLTPMVRSGAGAFVIGTVFFMLGFTVFVAGAVTQTLSVQKSVTPYYKIMEKETPIDAISEIEAQELEAGVFIDRLEYKNGKWEFFYKQQSEAAEAVNEDAALEEMNAVMASEGTFSD